MIIDKLDISSLPKINNNHFLHSADKYSTDKLKDTITIFKTEVKNKIQQMTDLNDIDIAKLTDQMKSMQNEFDDKINSLNQSISENKKIIEEYKNVEYKVFKIPDKVFILLITVLTIGLIIAIPLIILTIIGHGNLSFDPLFQIWSKINIDLKMNWNDAGDIVMFIVMFLPATIFVIFIIILISILIYYIIFSPLIIIEQISIRKKNKNEKIMNEKIKKCEEEITKRYNQIQPLEDSKQHETDIINNEVMKLNSEKELMLRTIDFLK